MKIRFPAFSTFKILFKENKTWLKKIRNDTGCRIQLGSSAPMSLIPGTPALSLPHKQKKWCRISLKNKLQELNSGWFAAFLHKLDRCSNTRSGSERGRIRGVPSDRDSLGGLSAYLSPNSHVLSPSLASVIIYGISPKGLTLEALLSLSPGLAVVSLSVPSSSLCCPAAEYKGLWFT